MLVTEYEKEHKLKGGGKRNGIKQMKKETFKSKATNTDIYAVTREFSPRLANLSLKSLIISRCENKIDQGFFHTIVRAPVGKFLFFLKLCDRPKWKQKKEKKKKKGSFALYVAMLTSQRFAFMFKPLPVKSKTKRKQNHTDTQNYIVITTEFQEN